MIALRAWRTHYDDTPITSDHVRAFANFLIYECDWRPHTDVLFTGSGGPYKRAQEAIEKTFRFPTSNFIEADVFYQREDSKVSKTIHEQWGDFGTY